jgi:uncharacterized protein
VGNGVIRQTILWRRLDEPGYESAMLVVTPRGYDITGTSVFAFEDQPVRLDYALNCDLGWSTKRTRVSGWLGSAEVSIEIVVNEQGWIMNGERCPAVTGCVDVDLNFSPLTNLLPIRRLNPAIGDQVSVRAAWLRFPSFKLEPLEQTYRRLSEFRYHYESGGGSFVSEIEVDEEGFATRYADFFEVEAKAVNSK